MTRIVSPLMSTLFGLLARLFLLVALTVPAYALHATQASASSAIEAADQAPVGMGFVLLVGLQRNRG
jgi:hypothetical protein